MRNIVYNMSYKEGLRGESNDNKTTTNSIPKVQLKVPCLSTRASMMVQKTKPSDDWMPEPLDFSKPRDRPVVEDCDKPLDLSVRKQSSNIFEDFMSPTVQSNAVLKSVSEREFVTKQPAELSLNAKLRRTSPARAHCHPKPSFRRENQKSSLSHPHSSITKPDKHVQSNICTNKTIDSNLKTFVLDEKLKRRLHRFTSMAVHGTKKTANSSKPLDKQQFKQSIPIIPKDNISIKDSDKLNPQICEANGKGPVNKRFLSPNLDMNRLDNHTRHDIVEHDSTNSETIRNFRIEGGKMYEKVKAKNGPDTTIQNKDIAKSNTLKTNMSINSRETDKMMDKESMTGHGKCNLNNGQSDANEDVIFIKATQKRTNDPSNEPLHREGSDIEKRLDGPVKDVSKSQYLHSQSDTVASSARDKQIKAKLDQLKSSFAEVFNITPKNKKLDTQTNQCEESETEICDTQINGSLDCVQHTVAQETGPKESESFELIKALGSTILKACIKSDKDNSVPFSSKSQQESHNVHKYQTDAELIRNDLKASIEQIKAGKSCQGAKTLSSVHTSELNSVCENTSLQDSFSHQENSGNKIPCTDMSDAQEGQVTPTRSCKSKDQVENIMKDKDVLAKMTASLMKKLQDGILKRKPHGDGTSEKNELDKTIKSDQKCKLTKQESLMKQVQVIDLTASEDDPIEEIMTNPGKQQLTKDLDKNVKVADNDCRKTFNSRAEQINTKNSPFIPSKNSCPLDHLENSELSKCYMALKKSTIIRMACAPGTQGQVCNWKPKTYKGNWQNEVAQYKASLRMPSQLIYVPLKIVKKPPVRSKYAYDLLPLRAYNGQCRTKSSLKRSLSLMTSAQREQWVPPLKLKRFNTNGKLEYKPCQESKSSSLIRSQSVDDKYESTNLLKLTPLSKLNSVDGSLNSPGLSTNDSLSLPESGVNASHKKSPKRTPKSLSKSSKVCHSAATVSVSKSTESIPSQRKFSKNAKSPSKSKVRGTDPSKYASQPVLEKNEEKINHQDSPNSAAETEGQDRNKESLILPETNASCTLKGALQATDDLSPTDAFGTCLKVSDDICVEKATDNFIKAPVTTERNIWSMLNLGDQTTTDLKEKNSKSPISHESQCEKKPDSKTFSFPLKKFSGNFDLLKRVTKQMTRPKQTPSENKIEAKHKSEVKMLKNKGDPSIEKTESMSDKGISKSSNDDKNDLNQHKRKRHKRSILDELANTDGYVAEKRMKSKGDNLFADPTELSREERALQVSTVKA